MLKEEYKEYIPKINAWEVEEYENQFKDRVYHDVKFDRSGEGEYSMKLYKGDSGVDANWSGEILLPGENHINWKFSLQHPPEINAQMALDEENYEIISKLYNYYKIWREEWSKMLTVPQDENPEGMEEPKAETSTELGAELGAEIPELGQEEPVLRESLILRKRSSRSTKNIIRDHGDRMKKLAGIK